MSESSTTHPTQDIADSLQLDSAARPADHVSEFLARLLILELPNKTNIFCAGYKAVIHIHDVVENCVILELTQKIDPETRRCLKKKPYFVKEGAVVECRVKVANMICIEKYLDFQQLGQFTLLSRSEGKTVAEGEVIGVTASEST